MPLGESSNGAVSLQRIERVHDCRGTFGVLASHVRDSGAVRLLVHGVALSATLAVLFGACWHFSRGGQIYFSTDTLETTTYSEVLIPVIGLPVYRSHPHSYQSELVAYLVSQGFWKARDRRQRPVMISHWNMQWRDGESDFQRMMWHRDALIAWSEAHPDLAAEFWPFVLQQIRDNEESMHNGINWLARSVSRCQTQEEMRALVEVWLNPPQPK